MNKRDIPKLLCDLIDAAKAAGLEPGVTYLRPELTDGKPQIVLTLRGLVVEDGRVSLATEDE